LAPLANGGIAWYLEPFDPVGTTVHAERWGGREALRSMSEELSELDDETLNGLAQDAVMADVQPKPKPKSPPSKTLAVSNPRKKSSRPKRRR
jgi:NuA3 HAT complex component NTO1